MDKLMIKGNIFFEMGIIVILERHGFIIPKVSLKETLDI